MTSGLLNRTTLRRHLCCVGIALAAWTSPPAAAAIFHDFRLAPDSLEGALKKFSALTGVSFVYDTRIVEGRPAPALYGPFTEQSALRALLADTKLAYRQVGENMFVIYETPEADAVHFIAKNGHGVEHSPAQPIDEMIVTASYRAQGRIGGFEPDYRLDNEAIQLSGAQNVAEPIFELPSAVATVSASNTALLISANGLNLTDLRGLGPQRSLVLTNGRRFVRTPGGNGDIYGVDLNALPVAFIEAVDIINQGAGPSLGTDAVAGVVNIRMRDRVEGLALQTNGGLSQRGDAGEYAVSVIGGARAVDGRAHFTGGLAYAADPSLFFAERDYLAEPYGFALNGRIVSAEEGDFLPGYGGSPTTPRGAIVGAIGPRGVTAFAFPDRIVLREDGAGFEPQSDSRDQRFNWVEGFSALPEIDRLHAYGDVDFEASNSTSFYAETFFSRVEVRSQVAPTPATLSRGADLVSGDALVIPADHPAAPAGLREAVEARAGGAVDAFLLDRRFVELGPRRRAVDRQTLQLYAGAETRIAEGWNASFDFAYGRSRTRDLADGFPNEARALLSADPDACAADDACVAANFFTGLSINPAAAAYYEQSPTTRRIIAAEQSFRAGINGEVPGAGARRGEASLSAEIRRDALNDAPQETGAGSRPLGEFIYRPAAADVLYSEVTASARFPLLEEKPFFQKLDFGVDGRGVRWTGGGAVGNLGVELSWFPHDALELYAHGIIGGRAPNIVELRAVGPDIAEFLVDPCATPARPVDCDGPGPLSAPFGLEQTAPLILQTFSGNPDLSAERVRTRHFGAAADLSELMSLSSYDLELSIDWRDHRISNAISAVDPSTVLEACYGKSDPPAALCGRNPATGDFFLQRDPATGALIEVQGTYVNDGEIRTSGLDANLSVAADLDWAPQTPDLKLDVLYAYTHRATERGVDQSTNEILLGRTQFPRHQFYAAASLETEAFKTQWTIQRRGRVSTLPGSGVAEATIPATIYVDAAAQWRPRPDTALFAGIENLFDKNLPVAAFAERGFHAEYYDVIGRRFFAGLKVEL